MTTSTQTIQKGYKQSEIGVIPTDWEIKQLGDVGEIRMCRRIFNHQTKEKGAIPFYKIGTFGNEADAYIPEDLYNNYRRRFSFPKNGDVLISAAGTIGRTIVYDGRPAYFQDSNIIWIDNNEKLISNSYLYYVLQIAKYNTEGGTIQRLYNNILNSTKFICPLKPEQSAIATTLSDTDSLIAKLEKLIEKKKNIKQGAMQELLTGKRRLPGFNGKWETKKFGELLNYEQPTEYLVKHTDYSDDFNTPVLTAGKTFVLGYTGEETGIFQNLPTIIFDDFTTAIKYVDFPFKAKSSAMKMLIPRSKEVNLKFVFAKMQMIDFQLGDHKRHWIAEYQNIEIATPKPDEQNAIATILSDMDAEIEKLKSQLTKHQNLKQGMMQVLLTGKIRLLSK